MRKEKEVISYPKEIKSEMLVPKYSQQAIETQVESFLLGKVLTIIDASYTDREQRQAVKSLIMDKFHTQMDWLLDRKGTKDQSND